MEQEQKKERLLAHRVVSIVGIVVSLIFLISFVSAIVMDSVNAGMAMPFGNAMLQFFQSNGFNVLLIMILLVGLFVAKKSRALLAKTLMWGILLLTTLYLSAFFTYLVYLPQMPFAQGVDFFAQYTPSICAIVALVALLSNWQEPNKSKVHKIALVCSVISVLFTAYFILRILAVNYDAQIQALAVGLCGILAIMAVSLLVCTITKSRMTFDRIVYAMTEEEALLVELAEDGAEAAVHEFEEKLHSKTDTSKADAFIEEMISVDIVEEAVEEDKTVETLVQEMETAAEELATEIEKLTDEPGKE